MLKKIDSLPSSSLFFLLCRGKDNLEKHTHNREIQEKLQSFLSGYVFSLIPLDGSIDSVYSYVYSNFPEEIRNKLFMLIELFHRMSQFFLKTEEHIFNHPEKIYQKFLEFPQMQQKEEVLQIIFLNKYNKFLCCKEIFKNERNKIIPQISDIFVQALKLRTKNIILIQKTKKTQNIVQTENLKFARKIQDTCNLLGLCFLDYLVINPPQGYKSLKKIGIF